MSSREGSIRSSKAPSSSHNSKTGSTFSNMEERRLKALERAFIEAANIIINDDLMKVFREKKETHQFMFERIQEIINEGMREANDKYVNGVLKKVDDMSKYSDKLRKENKLLSQGNIELQKTVEELQNQYNSMFEEKIKEMSGEIDGYKETINMIQTESMKLEETIRRLKDDNQDLLITLRDKEKQESTAVATIKSLEEEIERMKAGMNKNESQYLQANSIISELREENDIKDKQKDQLLMKVKEMEKEMKKNDCMTKELANEFEVKMGEYKDENQRLKETNEELKEILQNNSKALEMKNKIVELEKDLKETEAELKKYKSNYDEAQFNVEQLEETVDNLKYEMGEQTIKLSEERKKKQANEIQLIELQDSKSELTTQNSELKDELASLSQERDFIKKAQQETEASLKQERRKAASLERELDQLRFSTETLNKDNNELIVGLKNQINHLKSENANLGKRLEKNLRDHQGKMEQERSNHIVTKDKLRMAEELAERKKIEVENLSKTVKFLKAQTYGKKSMVANNTSMSIINHKMSNSYSLSTQRAQLEFDHEADQQAEAVTLIETTATKTQLHAIMFKMRQFKDFHQREKDKILEEVKYYHSALSSVMELLVIRIREEAKKSKYLDKDVTRLKKDLEYLKKINDELPIKARSQKSLSKMTTLNYSDKYESSHSFINKPSQFNQTQPAQRPREDSLEICSKTDTGSKSRMMKTAVLPGIRNMKELDNYTETLLELQKPRPTKLFEKKPACDLKSVVSSNVSHCSISSRPSNVNINTRPSNTHSNAQGGGGLLKPSREVQKEAIEIESRLSKRREKVEQYTRDRRIRDRKEYYGKENVLQRSGTKQTPASAKQALFGINVSHAGTGAYSHKEHSHYSRIAEKMMEFERSNKPSRQDQQGGDRYERQLEALTDRTNNMNNMSAHLMTDTKNSEHKYGFTGVDRSFNLMSERNTAMAFGHQTALGTDRGSVIGDRFESHHIRFNTNEEDK